MSFIKIDGFRISYTEKDPYKEFMWEAFMNGGYEPTTVGFLLSNIKQGTTFIDVGASSGMLSLVAAKLGADVTAIEPQDIYFDALVENIRLNELDGKVKALKIGVSNYKSEESVASPAVFHHSVFTGEQLTENPVRIVKLSEVIRDAKKDNKRSILKIDIEGAEYAILKDPAETLAIRDNIERLFLALHPGFPYEYKFRSRLSWLLMALNSKIRGLLDTSKVFRNLDGSSTASLPNGRKVGRRWEFLVLTFFGVHDWVFDFSRSETQK